MNDKVAFINIGPDLSSKNNSIALIVGNVKPTTGYNQGATSEAEKWSVEISEVPLLAIWGWLQNPHKLTC